MNFSDGNFDRRLALAAGGGVAGLIALTIGYKVYVAPVVGAVGKVIP
jgi:hypothetical protein